MVVHLARKELPIFSTFTNLVDESEQLTRFDQVSIEKLKSTIQRDYKAIVCKYHILRTLLLFTFLNKNNIYSIL